MVGDLVVQPRVLDATRQVSTHGKRLAPVTVRGTPETEFKVVSASAGPVLDIACAPGKTKNTIVCTPTIAADAPAGPFGTTIEIRTDSLDQPVIQVPVYGNVAEIVKVVPPMVLFRNNNTPAGMTRRVKLQAAPQVELDIQDIRCDIDGVEYAIDMDASERYIHLRYLQIKLQKGWSGNTREGVGNGDNQHTRRGDNQHTRDDPAVSPAPVTKRGRMSTDMDNGQVSEAKPAEERKPKIDWADPNVPTGDGPPLPRWPLLSLGVVWVLVIVFLAAMAMMR